MGFGVLFMSGYVSSPANRSKLDSGGIFNQKIYQVDYQRIKKDLQFDAGTVILKIITL